MADLPPTVRCPCGGGRPCYLCGGPGWVSRQRWDDMVAMAPLIAEALERISEAMAERVRHG